MLFKEIKKIGSLVLIVLVFTRFSCYEEDKTELTILNISVTDEQTNLPVEEALIGLYSSSFCLLDTLSTDAEGKVEYAFLAATYEGISEIEFIRTIPRATNTSMSSNIKVGEKNDISLQTEFLQPVFDITIATSYQAIFMRSMDSEFADADDREFSYCVNTYGVKRSNDQVLLANNVENINFPFKGVFNKINYLYIEKYSGNTTVFDTLEILLTDEVYDVLIE